MKKPPGDIITSHMCTINDNHMMYSSWDMEHDWQNFFVILDLFLSFCAPNKPENQNFEKLKKTPGDNHFKHMYHKWQSYGVWFLRYWAWQTKYFCYFGPFFALSAPKNSKNQNFEKMKKAPGDIIILHKCTINENHMMYCSWDMKHDGQNFLSFWSGFCPITLSPP